MMRSEEGIHPHGETAHDHIAKLQTSLQSGIKQLALCRLLVPCDFHAFSIFIFIIIVNDG